MEGKTYKRRKVCISSDDDDDFEKVYRFKILLPNKSSIEMKLRNPEPEMRLQDFVNLVKREYHVARKRTSLETNKKEINWNSNLFLLDVNDAKMKDPVRFKNFDPHKCHFLRLQDDSGVFSHTFKNMWDLTPDTNLLLELPEEYTFETALADLIDNSLQAVWCNQENERRLIKIDLDRDMISIFDTGSGMDDTDENSLVNWGRMGSSRNRSYKSRAIGGKPPYLKPYFGMFGYGGPIASMHLGRRAVVSSKTKHLPKVYMLHLEREALLNPSNSDLTWKTDGGIRDPTEQENRDSNNGSFTKVDIFYSDFKGGLAKLQCHLKDIYFPYIQCDDMFKTRKTTTPIEFQVNGVDLTEIEGGEVAITNWHSCNGPEFVFQLRFSRSRSDNLKSPGSVASQEANARLRLVYLPFKEQKENIERVLEKLKADGFETKENFQNFSRVSVRRLGRLLPDARWGMLPFMDLRNKKGNNANLLKRCCLRVKCFIETDGGFKPTPSKTDLAHQNHFTTALKTIGRRVPEEESDVVVEIRRADKSLTPGQLESNYKNWIVQMHEQYDEEVDSGEDHAVIIVSPPNKKALGISSDVVRVHEKLKRKEKCWKRGEKIKVLKGAYSGIRNNVYATIEYFLLEGFEGDAGGEARIICRSMDVPNENGCILLVDYENASLDLQSSLSLPLSVIDSGKAVHVARSEWDSQLQQKSPAIIELLSLNQCQQLEFDGTLPVDIPVFAGQAPPSHVVAVVRPKNFMPGDNGKLDQNNIFKSNTEMAMEVKFVDEVQNSQDVILSERISPGVCKGFNGLYVFPLGRKLPDLFNKAGAYVFSFSLIKSSCKRCEKRVIVMPSTVERVELLSPIRKNQLLPGHVFKEFVLEMFDAYGNHVSKGSEVTLSLSKLVIEDQLGVTRKVDANGKIDLSDLLKLIAGFGENASLSVMFEDKVVFEQEFSTVKRILRIASKLPDTCVAGSQMDSLVFEVVDPDGAVDINIHHNDKDIHSHMLIINMLIIKPVSFQERKSFHYAFEHGRCTVHAISIPLSEETFCFSAEHSRYPKLKITVEIPITKALEAAYDDSQFPYSDISVMPLQNFSSFNQDENIVNSIVDDDEELLEILKIGQEIGDIEKIIQELNDRKAKIEEDMLKLQEVGSPRQLSSHGLCTVDELKERIKCMENSAAAVICSLLPDQMPQKCITDDIVNLVALLGTVQSPELSRVLAEYLGEDKMLAVICRTFEAASDFERYTQSGEVDSALGLHALAAKLGKVICRRFHVLCLEDIRPYNGCCQGHDPQRKLTLPVPTLPNGSVPAGFLGYAVNMIKLDDHHLLIRTAAGFGLRETVLFSLFRKLQVYETREYMMAARDCLEDGAVSLDGGIIRESGLISLGYGNSSICFPIERPAPITPETGGMIASGEKQKLMDLEVDIEKSIEFYDERKKEFQERFSQYRKIMDETQPVIENHLWVGKHSTGTTDNSNYTNKF